MANVAVLASGSGTNFQAIAEALGPTGHRIVILVCDKPGAYCLTRAQNLGIPSLVVAYAKGGTTEVRQAAERTMNQTLADAGTDLVVLAGFMRILTPLFVDRWAGKLINIHPALLPRHPGTHGIEDSYRSGDPKLGVTVHFVDAGMDTGPVIAQRSFVRTPELTLEEAATKIHALEHQLYPEVVLSLLDAQH